MPDTSLRTGGGWRALFAGLTQSQRRDVREILAEDYAAEIRLARQLAAHANRLDRYPDRRARLLEIARREEEHARWLREALERLGGRPRARVPSPPDARSNWERLVTDLEAEKRALEKLLDDAHAVQRDHPEIAALFLRIRQEEAAHQREIAWILARSDRMVLDRPSLDAVTRETFSVGGRTYELWSLHALERHLRVSLDRLPVSIRLLLENLLRHVDGLAVTEEQVAALARWSPFEASLGEIAFHPARVLLQEFTDVPALLDAARIVFVEPTDAADRVYPETAVGTDLRTPTVNAFGVLAWRVDEHEAEAAMSGQPLRMTVPYVVGVRVTGRLREGVTATDLALTLATRLRGRGAPGRFVEFCGPGLDGLAMVDRVTIASMAPQYGATVAFFPVDALTLDYLRRRGRDEAQVALIEAYAKTQGLFRTGDTPEPIVSSIVLLDLGSVEAPARAAR